jgi:hypothetical protein
MSKIHLPNDFPLCQTKFIFFVDQTHLRIISSLVMVELMIQGFLQYRLMSGFRKFYERFNDTIYNYKLSLRYMLSDIFHTNNYTVSGTLTLTTTLTVDNSAFMIMELGSRSTGDAYSS